MWWCRDGAVPSDRGSSEKALERGIFSSEVPGFEEKLGVERQIQVGNGLGRGSSRRIRHVRVCVCVHMNAQWIWINKWDNVIRLSDRTRGCSGAHQRLCG